MIVPHISYSYANMLSIYRILRETWTWIQILVIYILSGFNEFHSRCPIGTRGFMMTTERLHALWVYSFGNSVGESRILLWVIITDKCATFPIECSPGTFFRGLPQGIYFKLWLKRSFVIINHRIRYIGNFSWCRLLIVGLTTVLNYTMPDTRDHLKSQPRQLQEINMIYPLAIHTTVTIQAPLIYKLLNISYEMK